MNNYNNNNASRQSSYDQGGRDYDRSYNRRDAGRGRDGYRGGGGGGRNSRQQHQPDYSQLPLEQGIICSLKESFGFIYCADRPEEVFFHYSELQQEPADTLALDTEVEFRIGSSQRNDKLNAFQVRTLAPGTIVWQTEPEPGKVFRGLVERPTKFERGQTLDGTIRMLVEKHDGDQVIDLPEGPELYFRQNDYQPSSSSEQQQDDRLDESFGEDAAGVGVGRSTGSRRMPQRLLKGDLVEFSVVEDRRSKERYARDIKLIMSEKEKTRQEQEQKMMAEATEEVGVVTLLKGEYGFLLSNTRREEIYFHYSTIDMEESEHALGEGDLVLKEGQEMKFLVVSEGDGGMAGSQGRQRLSARRVSMEPKGSVRFHDAVACGVTGVVVLCPQPADAGHSLEAKGKVLLHNPIEDKDANGNTRMITEVYLSAKDSPGGTYHFRGGSSAATWIQLGDTVLFDVVSDYVDGACHAAPTKHLVRNRTPFELEEEGDLEHPISRRIRLLSLSLMARSHGTVHTVKEAYGFIHYAERPVDVHFKLHQVLPDELQNDLRMHMGLPNVDRRGRQLSLEVGSEVMFDISVHGRIQGSTTGRHQKNQAPHDRENLKAQRVLFLPTGTILQSKTLGTKLHGKISKKDHTQLYAGTIDLETAVVQMTLEERHPLVSEMVENFLASPVQTALVYHDILSAKEDDIVVDMIEVKANGMLAVTHIPEPGEPSYPGKLCIRKLSEDERRMVGSEKSADEINESLLSAASAADATSDDDEQAGTPGAADRRRRKRRNKAGKAISTIRFDKSSLGEELRTDAPLAVNDIVEFDVVQSRRTGMVMIENMRLIERLTPASLQIVVSSEGMGIVKEVVTSRGFGFIAVLDEAATKRETLFFHISSVTSASTGNEKQSAIRKGDEVSFTTATEKNGKRVAQNVMVLPRGTIPSRADNNACRGLILLEPSHSKIIKGPVRHMSSVQSVASDKASRWGSAEEELLVAQKEDDTALGCILLVEDTTSIFSETSATPMSTESPANDEEVASPKAATDGITSAVQEAVVKNIASANVSSLIHLKYKCGAIAIHGAGASDDASAPKRGDYVSFTKVRGGARDIRIVTRGAATMLRGRLEDICLRETGTAKFIAANDEGATFDVKLTEVLGCDASVLKEKEPVEGILHDGRVYGICRICDVYLDSKFGSNNKERPKLNLTVKKDRGGKIMAQSHTAKGPDGNCGFVQGWTTRRSKYESCIGGVDNAAESAAEDVTSAGVDS